MSMSDVTEREERPAYVRFETRPITDKEASLREGRNISVDEDWALITPPYSKDCVEKKVKSWFSTLEANARNNRIPAAWVKMYKEQYEAYKEGQEIPVNGISVKNWAILSPAQVQNLINAGCRTVEDLAQANDEALRRLGMGGHELRNKAQAFLKASVDHGSIVEENALLKNQLGQLQGTIESMQNQINLMVAKGASKPEEITPIITPTQTEAISVSDIIEPVVPEAPQIVEKPKFELPQQDPKLVAAYIEKFGKKPHHMSKDESIRKKLKE